MCIKVFMPNLCECVLLVSMKQLYITVEIITVVWDSENCDVFDLSVCM